MDTVAAFGHNVRMRKNRVKGKKTIALVSIRDAVVIEGVLPRTLMHRVLGWCVSHTKELLADWNLARQGKEPKWIDWTID